MTDPLIRNIDCSESQIEEVAALMTASQKVTAEQLTNCLEVRLAEEAKLEITETLIN